MNSKFSALALGLAITMAAGAAHAQGSCKPGPTPKPAPPKPGAPVAPPGDPSAIANLSKSRAFLAENAKDPKVVKLPSGAQYKVLSSGDKDGSCAAAEDRVKVIYEGRLIDGSVFDSSDGAAVTFALDDLIPGWKHVVPMMHVGDEWMIYLPPNLGYGEKIKEKIPPNSALIFKMKLVGLL